MNYGLGAYKKTSIHTASKERILLMLYEAAIKYLKLAISALENNKIAEKGENIGKFQDIIIELNNSLDYKVNREIADNLSGLYDYLIFYSTKANINKDKKALEECLNIVNILHSGWDEAIKSLK